MKVLAKQWETNYFTVQSALTPLANEGLIERTPRRGTFVRARLARLSSVGCYFGGNLWSDTEGAFYQKVYGAIHELVERRDIRCELFIDNRSSQGPCSELPALTKAVQNREIQGVIAMMLRPDDTAWLLNLGIPRALLQGTKYGIHTEERDTYTLVLDRLQAEGCTSVGLISRTALASKDLFREMAAERGMRSERAWCPLVAPNWDRGSERYAYEAFKQMWALQNRPEGLYVEADWDCRGAITAMLELGVRVPENLKLVLYRNSSVSYVCPWEVPAVVMDTEEVAAAFIDYIEEQHRTQRLDLPPPQLKARLVG
jgi:DNA-binding LacI/PurR family transcriptional regulator